MPLVSLIYLMNIRVNSKPEAERFRSGEVSEIISGHRERETVMKLGYKQYLVGAALVGTLALTSAYAQTPADRPFGNGRPYA
jgi:hypothetical protein